MSTEHRCDAAHPDDLTTCQGPPNAVKVIDQHGTAVPACVHHGARLYASLIRPRVHPGTVPGAALMTYRRAQHTTPFAWQHDGKQGRTR